MDICLQQVKKIYLVIFRFVWFAFIESVLLWKRWLKECFDVISDKHETSLTTILLDEDNRFSEADMTVTLAEHLFKYLAPKKSYVVDNGTRGKSACKCGSKDLCSKKTHFGETGLGRNYILLLINFPDQMSVYVVKAVLSKCLTFSAGSNPNNISDWFSLEWYTKLIVHEYVFFSEMIFYFYLIFKK